MIHYQCSTCFFRDRYIFPLIVCFSTSFKLLIIRLNTSTTRLRSISVFLLVNFFTRSFEVIGLRSKYRFTSSSVIVLSENSVFCFFEGGCDSAPPFPTSADALLEELAPEAVSDDDWSVPFPWSLSRFVPCLLDLLGVFFLAGEPAEDMKNASCSLMH